MNDVLPDRVRIGDFDVNLRGGEVRRGDHGVYLQEQPLSVLRMLVERDGEIVVREEIKRELWPNDTVVDFDQGINASIRKLRQAFCDSADEPLYIATIARRGYRLLVPVELVQAGAALGEVQRVSNAAVRLQPDPPLIGKKVSHYRVLDIIGGGGMGVVYGAEDLKLGRRVALKFLPEELGSDPQALERFSREARAASSLDHPNICPIHEFSEHEGRPFMVMQLLEGQTLRDRLAAGQPSRPLPLEELLNIGIQVSDGLQAAHDKGIVHRDIKPANIFLASKGVVKILDFGLAKLVEAPQLSCPSQSEREERSTRDLAGDQALAAHATMYSFVPGGAFTREASVPSPNSNGFQPITPGDATQTKLGVAMGSVGYMSPEQVRGEKLDARTDLFSFGLVLYEMATGERAFTGETAAAVHDAILHHDPAPIHSFNSEVPGLEAVISKSLEKDRERRYQSAGELISDLRAFRDNKLAQRGSGDPSGTAKRTFTRWLLVLTPIFSVAGVTVLFLLLRPSQYRQHEKEFVMRQLTPQSMDVGGILSPDGKHLVYYSRHREVSLVQIDTGEVRSFPNTASLVVRGWLPDGDHLFVTKLSQSGTWKMSTLDGSLQPFQDETMDPVASPNGQQVAFLGAWNEIWTVNVNGQNRRRILSVNFPSVLSRLGWSPTGKRLLCLKDSHSESDVSKFPDNRHDTEIDTCDLGGHCTKVLSDPRLYLTINYTSLVWLPDGRVVFALRESPPNQNGSNLWSLEVDPDTGISRGEPKRLTNWTGFTQLDLVASADGRRLAFTQLRTEMMVKVSRLNADAGKLRDTRALGEDNWSSRVGGWTHNGDTVLFTAQQFGNSGIFEQNVDSGGPRALILGAEAYDTPVITPDSRWLLYTEHLNESSRRLMRMPVAGGPGTIVLSGDYTYRCGSLPSASCVVADTSGNQVTFYLLDPLKGRGRELTRAKIANSPSEALYGWDLSADGRRIAFVDYGATKGKIRILSTHGPEEGAVPVKGWDSLLCVHWAANSDRLYVTGAREWAGVAEWAILETDLEGNSKVLLQLPLNRGWIANPIPSPDERNLIYTEVTWPSSLMMMEHF